MGRGDGEEARPLAILAREDQVVADPSRVGERQHLLTDRRMPHFVRFVGGDVRDHQRRTIAALERGAREAIAQHTGFRLSCTAAATGPWSRSGWLPSLHSRRSRGASNAADSCLRLTTEWRSRPADEGDLLAILRPDRTVVEVHAWREVVHRARLHVVDDHEAVIRAFAHERDLRSVG